MTDTSRAVECEDKAEYLNQERKADPEDSEQTKTALMILQEDSNGCNQQLGNEGDWTLPASKEGQSIRTTCQLSGSKPELQADKQVCGIHGGAGSETHQKAR